LSTPVHRQPDEVQVRAGHRAHHRAVGGVVSRSEHLPRVDGHGQLAPERTLARGHQLLCTALEDEHGDPQQRQVALVVADEDGHLGLERWGQGVAHPSIVGPRTTGVLYVPDMQPSPSVTAWRPDVPGVSEVLHASFTDHAYPLHTHDTWTLLLVDTGAVRYDLERHEHAALGSRVTLLPPGVPHDGRGHP
jgi:hypothetical protein